MIDDRRNDDRRNVRFELNFFFLNRLSSCDVESGEPQNITTMKNLLITLATVLIALVALPQKAEAGHSRCGTSDTYRSSYSTCGCPIYKRRVIISYDCYNRPVYRYYTVPIVHCCSSHYRTSYRRPHYRHGNHYSNHYRRPSYGHRSHISFSGRYGSVSVCR